MDKTITTLRSCELNQGVDRLKEAARNGPVFITDRGRPAYVLLSVEDYHRLAQASFGSQTLADLLAMPEAEDIEFDPPRLQGPLSKPVDFS